MVSMHARRIVDGDRGKSLWPAGCRVAGVFADPLGLRLLADGAAPDWWRESSVIVAEGVPDFLTFALAYGDDESCPAVLGFAAGGWTQAIADRIPDGCRVVLAGHGDVAGDKYNAAIASSLGTRCDVRVLGGGGQNEAA
jgi:hypothetical protein